MNHRDEVSAPGVGKVQLNLDIFGGGGGQVSRVDPAVVQAGTCSQEKQKSEACELCKKLKHASKMPRELDLKHSETYDPWWGSQLPLPSPLSPCLGSLRSSEVRRAFQARRQTTCLGFEMKHWLEMGAEERWGREKSCFIFIYQGP